MWYVVSPGAIVRRGLMACSPTIRTLTLHGSAKASLTARTSDFSQGRCFATHGWGGQTQNKSFLFSFFLVFFSSSVPRLYGFQVFGGWGQVLVVILLIWRFCTQQLQFLAGHRSIVPSLWNSHWIGRVLEVIGWERYYYTDDIPTFGLFCDL